MGDFWQAARANNVKRVKALLRLGVSPDVTRWSGVTPLHRAAEVNSCQVAQVLIKAEANVNARTAWGWYAPLHLALQNGHEHVAVILLQAGAKWTILTKRLQSPYDLAVARGHNMQALKIQKIARKTAEERRILQKGDPTDAITAKTRRLVVAERRQSTSLQQQRQHEQSPSRAGRKQSFLPNQQQEIQLQPPEAGRRQSCQQHQQRQPARREDSGPGTSQSPSTPTPGEHAAGIASPPVLQPMPDLVEEEGDCLNAAGDV